MGGGGVVGKEQRGGDGLYFGMFKQPFLSAMPLYPYYTPNRIRRERKWRGRQACCLVYQPNLRSPKASLAVDTSDHSDLSTEATINAPIHP